MTQVSSTATIDPVDLTRLRALLEQERSTLATALGHATDDSDGEASPDTSELDALRYQQGMSAAVASLTRAALADVEAALALNPAYGDAWAIPGYYASITRRYAESGQFYQRAVAVQPDHCIQHTAGDDIQLTRVNFRPQCREKRQISEDHITKVMPRHQNVTVRLHSRFHVPTRS